MRDVLEIEYRGMAGWALPLRTAIDANPALAVQDSAWSQGPLSDLAFAISTRLGYLPDIIRFVDESLYALDQELAGKDTEIDALRHGGYVYSFENYATVRRLLVGASSFITESRACFENLSRFYREFVTNYFEEAISVSSSYAALARMTPTAQWADDLQRIRHDLLHERSLWLAFQVRPGQTPRYEPLFLLNWRLGMFQPDDCVAFQMLRDIRTGLDGAASGLRQQLIERVGAAR